MTSPTPSRCFRVVSVDLWDTALTVGDRAAATAWRLTEFTRVLAEFGHHIPEQDLAAAVASVLDEHARRQRHTGWQSSPADQVSEILSQLNIPATAQLLELLVVVHSHARLRACPEPVPGAVPALMRLRSAGHTLVLSSNTLTCPGTVSRRILDDHELTDLFDHLCFSDQIGVAKPHPDFFAAVAAAASASGSDILHIGDDWRVDVEGAVRAGFSAAWLNPSRKPRPTSASVAVELYDIAALPELAAGNLPIPVHQPPAATPDPVLET